MIRNFFSLLCIFLIAGCKKPVSKEDFKNVQSISERVEIGTAEEVLYLRSGTDEYNFVNKYLPLKKAVVLNSSLLGYFSELGLEDRLVGVSSPEYIYSPKILANIENGKTQNIGNEQKYDVEKIIALQPDVIFTNHIKTFENTYELLKKHSTVIFLDEYLEEDPLKKSKYLLVFGKLLGAEAKAESLFAEIENNYKKWENTAAQQKNKPLVIANEMYGSQWFMPGGKSQFSHFVHSAGGAYVLQNDTESKAIPMSFEEVFVKAEKAGFWLNVGNHKSKSELLTINPNYAKMNVFNNGKLYALTGRERLKANDFFESGVVRADVVLMDYIKIFHPQTLPNHTLTYLKELK